jgi:hypothetical protein
MHVFNILHNTFTYRENDNITFYLISSQGNNSLIKQQWSRSSKLNKCGTPTMKAMGELQSYWHKITKTILTAIR